jgi:hypothetical protein
MPSREEYWRRPEYYRAKQRTWLRQRAASAAITRFKRSQKIRTFIQQLKGSTPCADCGKIYPHYVMEFDHRAGNERSSNGHRKVSELTSQRWLIVLEEISRCDIVCANCHHIRTWNKLYANGAWGEVVVRIKNRKFFVEFCDCVDDDGNGTKGCPKCKGRGAVIKYINADFRGNNQ